MKRADFLRVIGADKDTDYAPVAGMLDGGYGFAGYYNGPLNDGLDTACVLVNVRLVDLRGGETAAGPRISDFPDFLEEIVRQGYETDKAADTSGGEELLGRSIPLTCIPFDRMLIVYPVAHIRTMMDQVQREDRRLPSFLDLDNESIVIKLLRTKLW